MESVNICSNPSCKKPATMKCPTCIKLELPPSYFCAQECFKSSWSTHKDAHRPLSSFIENGDGKVDPRFLGYKFTGPLRPYEKTAMRTVPKHIKKPDYAFSGIPNEKLQSQADRVIPENTAKDIEGIRAACKLGREILDEAHRHIKPGVTTDEIDRIVHEYTISKNAYPSPLNYSGFPKSVCTSINEIICHGIPDKRPLEEGDIVNVDVSVFLDGYHGDLNETYLVGKVAESSRHLVESTYVSLMKAIEICKPGVMYRDVGNTINKHIDTCGLSVVRSYCGHGVGKIFHCAPMVPHYKKNKAVGTMKEGHIFTIEPMINQGDWRDETWPDGWTSATIDGQRSAQFEHTILITETGAEVLTARTESSPPLEF